MKIEVTFSHNANSGREWLTSNITDGTFDVLGFLFDSVSGSNCQRLRECLAQDEFFYGHDISHAEALAADGDTVRVWGPHDFMDTYARIKRSTLVKILDDWEQFLDDDIPITHTYED